MSTNRIYDTRITDPLSGGDVVCDLGCGAGFALDVLAERYERAIGLDISDYRLSTRSSAHSGWEFIIADLNQPIPLEDASGEGVLANQVIEHVYDPEGFASEVYRILKPGGVGVFTTPNLRQVRHLWRLVVGGMGPQTSGEKTCDGPWDDGHIHYFTHADVRKIFLSAGFSRVESRALIELDGRGKTLRRALNRFAGSYPVREFLSGNIITVVWK